jgi:TonB family protein
VIKSSLILVAAFIVTKLLGKRAASERHAVWTAAMLGAALLPLLSWLTPEWNPIFGAHRISVLPVVAAVTSNPAVTRSAEILFSATAVEPELVTRVSRILWFAGIIAVLLVFVIAILQQRREASRSKSLTDSGLNALASQIARDIGCSRSVDLRQSALATMPMTWGVVRPKILLPASIGEWTDQRKRVVITHELAHVQRLDWLIHTCAQLICSIYWFNPLFWFACSRLHRESEQACDDVVINFGIDARDYASHLLEIARRYRQSRGACSAILAMARTSTLERRFTALLTANTNRRSLSGRLVILIAMATCGIVVPLAAMKMPNVGAIPMNLDAVAGSSAATASPIPIVEQYTSPPLYSDEARARAIEGIVTVETRIGADGAVQRLRIVKGLGYGLDENALLAVRDWRFIPAKREGRAIEATTQIDVEFSLRNAELNEEIANDMATRIGPGVTPPQVVHRIEPQFVSSANHVDSPAGAVVLDAVILENGTPKIVRVIRSLDWELDEIAINALKQWRFSPAVKDGVPIKVRMNIAVNFQPRG